MDHLNGIVLLVNVFFDVDDLVYSERFRSFADVVEFAYFPVMESSSVSDIGHDVVDVTSDLCHIFLFIFALFGDGEEIACHRVTVAEFQFSWRKAVYAFGKIQGYLNCVNHLIPFSVWVVEDLGSDHGLAMSDPCFCFSISLW